MNAVPENKEGRLMRAALTQNLWGVGDRVIVTAGPHKGASGLIKLVDHERQNYRVRLNSGRGYRNMIPNQLRRRP